MAHSLSVQTRLKIAASVQPILKGGCTKNTSRCADARDYGVELRSCCRGHIRTVVANAMTVLDKMGVVWWADYGTLLGAVRNPLTTWADYPWLPQGERSSQRLAPGIIPHDKDADFGILANDQTSAFLIMTRVRHKIEREFGHQVIVRGAGRSMKIRLSFANHSNADFFAWWPKGGDGILTRKYIMSLDRYKGRDVHRDNLFPLSKVEWEGMQLPAPKNPVAFAEFRYGSTWMTPVRANNDGVCRGFPT